MPGRFRGDLAALSLELGAPVERGPDEVKDLPVWLGRGALAPDLSRYDIGIFAEIIDALIDQVAAEIILKAAP